MNKKYFLFRSFPSSRDCESIIPIWLKELFTTENTKSTEKINLLFQCIKNFVFSVFSVVILYCFSKNEYFHNLSSLGTQFPEASTSRNPQWTGSWSFQDCIPKLELGNERSNGFTLVEMTVVLLLITLLASVAVRETAELGFQTRYEQTKERLEMIKQAILGNPKLVINGQQAVSGFVADMGRLPDNLRELFQPGACYDSGGALLPAITRPSACVGSNVWVYLNVPCSNNLSNTKSLCLAAPATWLGKDVDTQTGLMWGWQGPYLNISGNPADIDALTDGWGTTTDNLFYGWRYELGLNLAMLGDANSANDQSDPDGIVRLVVQSFGKDQVQTNALPTNDFIDDFPSNVRQNDAGVYYPNPLVEKEDWLVDISGGIKTNIKLPLRDTRQIPPVSFCTDSTKTTKATCTLPNVWFGGCEDQTYFNKSSCETASKIWHLCSDESSPDKTSCETAGAVWYGEGFGCEDQTKTSKTNCTAAIKLWRSCTDDGTITTQSACAAANQIWYGESLITTGENGGCSDIHYTNKASCLAASKTWQACSIVGATTFLACEATGGYWLGNGYGCSDQQYSNQADCELNNKQWVESWPRCKKSSAPNTESLVPYHNIKTGKYECEDISGNWKYPRKQVCLNVFYRNNGNLNWATSLPTLIEENGAYQTIQFNFAANPVFIPTGQNAIGIYEYDGDCDPVNNPLYPADRQNPIQVDFHAHTALPVINW
ncbi:MAG: prepilin-type N-terminal cleavage/methylation domain-containing protein [Gammaproteobacteria bacterium]